MLYERRCKDAGWSSMLRSQKEEEVRLTLSEEDRTNKEKKLELFSLIEQILSRATMHNCIEMDSYLS